MRRVRVMRLKSQLLHMSVLSRRKQGYKRLKLRFDMAILLLMGLTLMSCLQTITLLEPSSIL